MIEYLANLNKVLGGLQIIDSKQDSHSFWQNACFFFPNMVLSCFFFLGNLFLEIQALYYSFWIIY